MRTRRALLVAFMTLFVAATTAFAAYNLSAPAGDRYATLDRDKGEAILPNGRIVKVYGRHVMTAPHPYGLTLSPDGQTAVTANSGVGPFSFSVVQQLDSASPTVKQIPPGAQPDKGILDAVFMGIAFLPDNRTVVASGGNDGTVMLWDVVTDERLATIETNGDLNGVAYAQSYTGDLALTKDGKTAYVCDQANFRVVIIDVAGRKVVGSVKVGRYPFGIALSKDESRVYVANVGVFEYSVVEGFDGTEATALKFPPFGVPSKEAEEGVTLEDGRRVPGLGDPNVPESFSVWTIDTETREVVAKVKTGVLVGELVEGIPAVGGSSPNSIAVNDDYVFVSNGSNDSVSVLSADSNRLVMDIQLRLHPAVNSLRGMIPFGVALSPDGSRLYVAASGVNAVAVIDTRLLAVKGYLPTAAFPSKLKVTPDGKRLVIACAKGLGSGPNGGEHFTPGEEGRSIGRLMKGVVQICDIPDDSELAELTQQVVERNFHIEPASDDGENPVPQIVGKRESPIEYVVYITKENRTYDQIYGDYPKGSGDPSLARFGIHRTVENRDKSKVVENVNVMPNHRKLAERFAMYDNFYCDADHSADGHRWLVGVYPNEWVETGVSASYGGQRSGAVVTDAPGRRLMVGASGAIYPEDYNEAGSIWEHLERHNIHFWNYGLGFEFAGGFEDQQHRYTGIRIPINYPMPQALYERTSRNFATYNTNVPDQFRVDMFEKELNERWLSGKEPFPRFISMMLPNDHGAGERPADGYPFLESYMSDNDLALGRVVEMLSKSPWWDKMVIIVTEDDSQAGLDHIDAHRSLCLVISPYAKRGHVSRTHVSFGSIIKTFEHILGIPALNQYDGGSSLLTDAFTAEPDTTPYAAFPVHPEVFDPQKALDPYDENFDWVSVNEYPEIDGFDTIELQLKEEVETLEGSDD